MLGYRDVPFCVGWSGVVQWRELSICIVTDISLE